MRKVKGGFVLDESSSSKTDENEAPSDRYAACA